MAGKDRVPIDLQREADFDRAFALLQELVDLSEADRRFPLRSNAIYTTSVVLWLLIYQRMNPDASLEAAVKMLADARPQWCSDASRTRRGKLSTNTGGYSRARSRLPRDSAEWLCHAVSQSLIEASPACWEGRRVFVLDGTTITLPPTRELRRAFPPASNQHGPGVWPVALLVMTHELASGAALIPQVGTMYGEHAVSETALVRGCLDQMPPQSILMADSAHGIFAVAWTARQTQHPFVFRLTSQRFAALRRGATLVARGPNWKTYAHVWCPTSKERQNRPDIPPDATIKVQIHEIDIRPSLSLILVTDLPHSALTLAELYRCRSDIEIDIRNHNCPAISRTGSIG